MEIAEIKKASKKSVKWSLLTEFFAKIATPLSTAILARILLPEIFGITAAVSIIVTFCEAVTDLGFAKFIIQHDFSSEDEYQKSLSVSIILSLFLSAILFVIIFIFRSQIAEFVGCKGHENILTLSCLQLPLYSINSIYIAHLRRSFKYNVIFVCKIIYCLSPFIVTLPLAILNFGPWSLVTGAIAAQLLQAPFLLFKNRKLIKPYFSFKLLADVFKYSYLMIIESIIIWMITWISTFISTQFFSTAVVGLVKVSNSTVTNIFALFATSFTNVLFSTLSRFKDNDEEFKDSFYSIQSCAFTIVIPAGIGCFFFSDIIVKVFLGNQWAEASSIVAILSLAVSMKICFNNFISEVFRAKGHFISSILYHFASLLINVILKFIFGRDSLEMFIWTTVFSYFITMIIAIIILALRYGFSLTKQIQSLLPSVVCCVAMLPVLILERQTQFNSMQSMAQILICAISYFSFGLVFYKPLFRETFSYLGIERLIFRSK